MHYPQCLWLNFEKSFKSYVVIFSSGLMSINKNNSVFYHQWIYFNDNCRFVSWDDLTAFHS